MNAFNYVLRYLWVLVQVNYEENYWEQVAFDEQWHEVVRKLITRNE